MEIQKQDSNNERQVLIGMIVERSILSRVAARWSGNLFETDWCNLIAGWCLEYFGKYDKAPGKNIESLYDNWAVSAHNKSTIKLIGEFLGTLSDEYELLAKEINIEYIIDLAGKHFNQVKLQTLAENIQSDLHTNKLDKAEQRIIEWGKVELGEATWIDPLHDKDAIRAAFNYEADLLISFPGAIGKFFGDSLERDGFIAIVGPDKRGKSFWLTSLAFQALLQRRKVGFFESGDLSQNQIMRRLMIYTSQQPKKACTINYPRMIQRGKDERTATVVYKPRTYNKGLDWQIAWDKTQAFIKTQVKSNENLFRLTCYPNTTLNVATIQTTLNSWERDGWIPDAIFIDYADIMAPDNTRLEKREQIDDTWRRLRALSQSKHCLVVTASQSDTPAYNSNIITKSNFSGSKTKNAHVTGMVGLNQTPEEKALGITRLNWIVRREGAFSETLCVHVAGSLALANPAIRSCW